MTVSVGEVVLNSPSLKLLGLYQGESGVAGQQFIDGGFTAIYGPVGGKSLTLTATLDSTQKGDVLQGWYTWADILALRALPYAPQLLIHPLLDELGETEVRVFFDKTSLDGLTQYTKERGPYVNPNVSATYPGTDILLKWYGNLNFYRV